MPLAIQRALIFALLLVGSLSSCGKDTVGAAPRPATSEQPVVAPATDTGGPEEMDAVVPSKPRIDLEAEFHRTRFGLGTGIWVLGVVHNPHAGRVTDVRVQVRLLDEAEEIVGQAEGRVRRAIGPGERAAVAVQVPEPVAHEQLWLGATAIVDDGPTPEPLPLRMQHEAPQRADFGGWYVVGKVESTGTAPVEGARIEIQAFDESGKLLGIDWLALDPVDPGETVEFDVGDLRYEEAPAQFLLELRGPALE